MPKTVAKLQTGDSDRER